ncbi:MAG: hypothetical protein QXQ08_01475 [Candidatus Bathyarchaeia archaeon]|nr:hypothetical protein [Candidatus Bathyarchaeota archaeon]
MMLEEKSLSKMKVVSSMFIVVNSFVWLICSSAFLKKIYDASFPNSLSTLLWSLNSFSAAFSILFGAFLGSKIQKRKVDFFFLWILFGTLSSLSPILVDVHTLNGSLLISILFSASLGIGLASCMANFAEHTSLENRGKIAGATLLLIMAIGVLVSSLMTEKLLVSSIILAMWRVFCFIPLRHMYVHEKQVTKKAMDTFTSVLKDTSFVLYMIPWTTLLLINHLFISVGTEVYGGEIIYASILVENFLVGIFAIVSGFICDIIGRKRLAMIGFVILGLGYAILGIFPFNILCWYIYILIDGSAWGMLYVIFLFTIWGDLSSNKSREKYYAIASLPYILSNFLRFTFGPIIAATLSAYAIFSFAAFFLFLAVIPLMFAPETLPEKVLKERELRSYIEQAKRVREKFTKG